MFHCSNCSNDLTPTKFCNFACIWKIYFVWLHWFFHYYMDHLSKLGSFLACTCHMFSFKRVELVGWKQSNKYIICLNLNLNIKHYSEPGSVSPDKLDGLHEWSMQFPTGHIYLSKYMLPVPGDCYIYLADMIAVIYIINCFSYIELVMLSGGTIIKLDHPL